MSRVGKQPVAIPPGVTVRVDGAVVHVKGPKAELRQAVLAGTTVTVEGAEVKVTSAQLTRNPMFGTMRAHIANMVAGVTAGFSRTLEIVGTGYRAQMEGGKLVLQLGFSHPIEFKPPAGITIKVENPTRLSISGADKYLVGQVAADIRGFRPPEPYKGKGIKYEGEYIRRKAGKAAGATT
ncbi:MAG TPA: 50S ribosomal protein L6 [Candidatus Eisenbacteria bacterium]|nr:50S ribosomal protein L6 [Candidatus Eisenbacteria bacterium]